MVPGLYDEALIWIDQSSKVHWKGRGGERRKDGRVNYGRGGEEGKRRKRETKHSF